MQYRAMLEQQVANPVDITHLDVRAGQKITLLVALRDSHGDVSFQTGEFVSLYGDNGDNVPLLALDTELSDGSRQITLLVRRYLRADHKSTETTQRQEQLCQGLVLEDELKGSAVDKDAILLVLIEELSEGILAIGVDQVCGV